jgi:hypothetical protein
VLIEYANMQMCKFANDWPKQFNGIGMVISISGVNAYIYDEVITTQSIS